MSLFELIDTTHKCNHNLKVNRLTFFAENCIEKVFCLFLEFADCDLIFNEEWLRVAFKSALIYAK